MFALLLVLMEGYQRHLHQMCDRCGSYVMATSISIMGLLFFSFLHEIITNKFEHIIELEGPSHIFNFTDMEECGRNSWEWQCKSSWWSLPTPCLNFLKVFIRSRYDCMIVVHRVATPCICLLSASQHYVQVFMLLPKM